MRIVGITYPDVILGLWVTGEQSDQDLAKLSLVRLPRAPQPGAEGAYASVGGAASSTSPTATGAYTPLEQTTTLAPYGTIPVAVAKVCELTYYCQFRDIHARTSGYRIIAQLIAKTLPSHRRQSA